jgi:hypothetical protein
MSFKTKGHTVEETNFVSNYLSSGIHEAKIQKIEFFEASSGTPGMKITHEGRPMEDLGGAGQVAETTWWLSDNAWTYTKDRLVIMADKLGVRTELDAIEGEEAAAYCSALDGIFKGKVARWKFAGEEIAGKEGKQNWFKAGLSGYGFVESLDTSPSKLKFDETNKYDMKRLPVADSETVSSNGTTATAAVSSNSDDPWS